MGEAKFKRYDLNRKVDAFVEQYAQRLREEDIGTDVGKYHFPQNLRNFIEAKAVFAELRWPSAYYAQWRDKEKQKTAEAQQIFTWERFYKFLSADFVFPPLKTTDQCINQQVLHRIIERGESRSGARRGVLFAQDFKLDVNIPVAYAIDWSDPYLYEFLKPLIPQLRPDTMCPVNYFSRTSASLKGVEEVRLEDVLSRLEEREKKRLEDIEARESA